MDVGVLDLVGGRMLVFLSLVYVDVGLNVEFLYIFLLKYHGSLCTSSFRELHLSRLVRC